MKDLAPSPQATYRETVVRRIRGRRADASFLAAVKNSLPVILVLWQLDLELARVHLGRCYAANPRGGRPWDPVVLFRCYLLGLLLKVGISVLVDRLQAEPLLRIIAGLADLEVDRRTPGVGTFYDFLHRVHDGPRAVFTPEVMRPSVTERRATREPRRLESKAAKKKYGKTASGSRKRRKEKDAEVTRVQAETMALTEKIVGELAAADKSPNPENFTTRMNTLLLDVAVKLSAEKGFLGKVERLVVSGDGSAVPTGASGHGKKNCGHGKREPCECPRLYADPDAQRGYDAFRKTYYYGHHFYEIGTGTSGHDLPLHITIAAANVPENGMALHAFDRLNKEFRDQAPGWNVGIAILDAGHDNISTHRYLIAHGIAPVIPLGGDAPACHPTRPQIKLSPKGIPLCEGGAEMAAWGSAGAGRPLFICSVKAGRLARCPMAPEGDDTWVCHPEMKYGPSICVKTSDNPRLFPAIQRNSRQYAELYPKRTGSERSNSVKKETFDLLGARHRRSSLWFIRLIGIAILQHAKAWAADADLGQFLAQLIGPDTETATT